MLSYIGPLFIIGRLSKRRCNRLIDFHSWQGGILFFTVSFLNLALTQIVKLLSIFPIFAEVVGVLMSVGIFTLWVMLSIMGIVNASRLDTAYLPLIGLIDTALKNHYRYM